MSTKRLAPLLSRELGRVSFALFMRAARTTLGLTQVEMSKRVGMAKGTLCDIEKGRQLVSPALALRVAKKAGLSPELAVRASLQDQIDRIGFKKRVELVG